MKEIKFIKTDRGFTRINFLDLYDIKCSLQESSLATDNAIWLGVNENRMHLNKKMVGKLIKKLFLWYLGGELK